MAGSSWVRVALAGTVLGGLGVAAPAHAGPVSTYGPTETLSATTLSAGSSVLDARVASTGTGVAVATGVTEGFEIGLGTRFPLRWGPAAGASLAPDALYPWVRVALPWGSNAVKTGLAAGMAVPTTGSSSSGLVPGVAGLVEVALGPVTVSANLGAARALSAAQSSLSGMLAVSVPVGSFTVAEEQYVESTLGGATTTGLRAALTYPLGDTLTVDASATSLWASSGWSFVPAIGADWNF